MTLDQLTNKKKETEQQAQRGIKGLCTLVPLAHKELRTLPAEMFGGSACFMK